jgi:hypothetical protein
MAQKMSKLKALGFILWAAPGFVLELVLKPFIPDEGESQGRPSAGKPRREHSQRRG